MTAMSGDDCGAQRKSWGCVIGILASFPVVYALSLGPVAWLHYHSPEPIQNVIEIVYMPLLVVCQAAEDNYFFETFFKPYVE